MLEEKTTRSFAIGAAAGLTAGLAANVVRKIFVQAPTFAAGEWDDALAAEHRATLALFDQIEKTEDSHRARRAMLLTQIGHALAKHAIEEENAVYPAVREADSAHDADALNGEHGYVKTYLYELGNMPAEGAAWLAKARKLRALLEEHIKMEETEVFPALKRALTEEQNAKLTAAVNREGLKLA